MAAVPFEHPKLAVTATVNAGDFADQLGKAVERSRMVSMIEAKPIIEGNVSASPTASDAPSDTTRRHMQANGGGKPMIPDRRYRRW
jgi:hypothetical protein